MIIPVRSWHNLINLWVASLCILISLIDHIKGGQEVHGQMGVWVVCNGAGSWTVRVCKIIIEFGDICLQWMGV